MKKIILLFLLLPVLANAQYFEVFDVDTSEYPIMKAKFYSIDEDGNQILNHTPTDFEITENGEPRDVISVSCPDQKVEPFSVVIAVDISSSMGEKNIITIKNALESFIDLIPKNGSEVAIIAFNSRNYYLSDFTTDKSKLLSKIKNIKMFGGTDFNAAFIRPIAGALLTMEKAKFPIRNVVLVTDGEADGDGDKIISKSNNLNSKIYSIVIEQSTTGFLRNISNTTNGRTFSNIITEEEFEEAFIQITKDLILEPCELIWSLDASCVDNINLKINNKIIDKFYNYELVLRDDQIAKKEISTNFIFFDYSEIGETKDTTITIVAENIDQTINSIKFEPDNGLFKISQKTPIFLKKNEKVKLDIKFTALDSNSNYTVLKFDTGICRNEIGLLSGSNNQPLPIELIELTHPNGGEVFIAGSDTIITWEGIAKQEKVFIEFSSNGGTNWKLISDSATNLNHLWSVPKIKSDSCLVAVNHYVKGNIIKSLDSIEWEKFYGGSHSDAADFILQTIDGGFIIVGSSWSDDGILEPHGNSGLADIWVIKLNSDGVIEWSKTFGGNKEEYATSLFELTDGGYIITGNLESLNGELSREGYDIFILKLTKDGDIDWLRKYANTGDISSSQQTLDNGYIFTGSNSRNSEILILKVDYSGNVEWQKSYGGTNSDRPQSIQQTYDKGYIIAGHSNSTDFVFENVSNKGLYDVFVLKIDSIGNIEWLNTFGGSEADKATAILQTYDGNYIVVGNTESNDGDFENTQTNGYTDSFISKLENNGETEWIKTFGGSGGDFTTSNIQAYNGGYIYAVSCIVKDGDFENFSGLDTGAVKIIHVNNNGETVNIYSFGGADYSIIRSIVKTNKGGYIFTGYSNLFSGNSDRTDLWTFKLFDSPPLQSDTSDAVFSIIMPEPVIQNNDIDMGEMIVGSTKDTIVSSVICNTGEAPLHVLGVDITDAYDSEDFLIPRGAGDFYLEKDSCQDMMFEFTPTLLGNRTAVITIRTTIGDFKDTIHIRGVGINPVVEATAEIVDFGIFELGEGKDTNVVLVKNVGNTDITITDTRISGPDMEQFTLNNTPVTYTIPAGQEEEFELNYTAKYGGRTSSILEFHYDGIGSPLRSMLFAEGVGGEVYPEVPDAFVGETVDLSLFLGKIKPEGLNEVATNFSATVSYNSTLLAPIDKSKNISTIEDKSFISITGQLSGVPQIAAVPMKVGLGTADKSGLVITEFQLYNSNGDSVDYDIEPGVGEFNVLGICEEGGQRLLNPNSEATLLKLLPNRTSSLTTVEMTLIESGQTELIVYDQIGNKIETIFSGNPDVGTQEITLDLSQYANGRYYIKLTTPTISKTEILEVVR